MYNRIRRNNIPTIRFSRSAHDMSHNVNTSMNVGRVTPLDIIEVLPGDTWNHSVKALVRLTSTMYKPIMDNMVISFYSFFVPLRLCYDGTEGVFGDTSVTSWQNPTLGSFPQIPANETVAAGSVYDYLGLCPGTSPTGASVLPARAFALIWNEWFRVETVQPEVLVQKGAYVSASEAPNSAAWSATNYGGALPLAARLPDYFSKAFPNAQRGHEFYIDGSQTGYLDTIIDKATGQPYSGAPSDLKAGATGGLIIDAMGGSKNGALMLPSVRATTLAFQLQKMLERDALYGTRYREYLFGHYGVDGADSRLQVPELLAGCTCHLNINQVTSTAQTLDSQAGTGAPLADLAALSQTFTDKDAHFTKSFTEHGYIITVGVIRYKHMYPQGEQRLWYRTQRDHFYDPLFANLGAQPVYKRELYRPGGDAILGYQEAWAEYRCLPDRCSGQMRTGSTQLGYYWSLAEQFSATPSLADVALEDPTSFKRVVSVPSEDDFILNLHFSCKAARTMPAYSVPGLIDHH